ncbi:MAG: beta-propeller domain-containing protein [Nitrospirae bacterium]|nr:beta-propeller domain-containing protein [Candidatus Manganitrophaceae bacterium]
MKFDDTNRSFGLRVFSLFLTSFLFLLIGSCKSKGHSDPSVARPASAVPLSALKLTPSADCDELKQYLTDALIERYTDKAPPFCIDCPQPAIPETTGGNASGVAGGAHPDDVTRTNTQEEGVDEADRVKADAEGRLYVVNGGFLVIEEGFPPEGLQELSRLKLESVAYGLYLDEAARRVVIFASQQIPLAGPAAPVTTGAPIAAPFRIYDQMIFVDVADPAHPQITARLSTEGFQIDSRRVGKRIHRVSRFQMPEPTALTTDSAFLDLVNQYRQIVWNGTGSAEETKRSDPLKEEIKQAVQKAMTAADPQGLLPHAFRRVGETQTEISLLSCSDILLPEVKEDLGLLIVTSVDIDGSNLAATALINNAWLAYASKEYLYVAQSSGGWWWDRNQAAQTALYKFRISDQKPVYVATGSIDGWISNRFNLSEENGFLRAASTEQRINPDTNQFERKNHIFVLEDDQAGELQVVGSVDGFAPGESITGARFLGDRGFVVTFRQVDPLFAFDLSNPRQPKLIGELTIPGFSTYLHPLDANHLLTVASESGSVALQLFDVTDLIHPKLLHKFTPAGGGQFAWSDALWDPHAFTFYAPRNLLAIPLVLWNPAPGNTFSGIAAFRVSVTDGFTELGRVDHADLAFQVYCTNLPPDQPSRADACRAGLFLGGAAPIRSVFMTSGSSTFLYSLSNIGIKATPVDQPTTLLGSVLFPDPGYGWWLAAGVSGKPSL